MSDLGAIFHVKKAGVQYDAHAYTTLDECPEPNLKLTYKGQQGHVKLTDKGNGDVPCYVKLKSGNTVYQVKKQYESVPTGSTNVGDNSKFTVPNGVKVVRVFWSKYESDETSGSPYAYVGVTPGKSYTLTCYTFVAGTDPDNTSTDGLYLGSLNNVKWFQRLPADEIWDIQYLDGGFTLDWSPEINKMTPTYTDY